MGRTSAESIHPTMPMNERCVGLDLVLCSARGSFTMWLPQIFGPRERTAPQLDADPARFGSSHVRRGRADSNGSRRQPSFGIVPQSPMRRPINARSPRAYRPNPWPVIDVGHFETRESGRRVPRTAAGLSENRLPSRNQMVGNRCGPCMFCWTEIRFPKLERSFFGAARCSVVDYVFAFCFFAVCLRRFIF